MKKNRKKTKTVSKEQLAKNLSKKKKKKDKKKVVDAKLHKDRKNINYKKVETIKRKKQLKAFCLECPYMQKEINRRKKEMKQKAIKKQIKKEKREKTLKGIANWIWERKVETLGLAIPIVVIFFFLIFGLLGLMGLALYIILLGGKRNEEIGV